MSTYTKNLNDIYFLNDKNIVQDLHGKAIPDVNAIPSLSLLQDSYRELSDYTDMLSVSLSNTVTSIAEDIIDKANKLELSVNGLSSYVVDLALSANGLSNYTKDLALSANGLSNYTKDLALSTNGLSNYTKDLALSVNGISAYVDKLELSSSGISTAVEEKFVHKSGDTIAYLNVIGQLSAKSAAEIDGNVRIHGSLVQGESVKATQKGGIALGISAEAVHTNSFVWNGNDNIENYQSHGERGTFNINPEQGTKGFYVGEKTLSDIIKNDIEITTNILENEIKNTSVDISAQVDINRSNDKIELSNVLSTYSNSQYEKLSVDIDTNRTVDKSEVFEQAKEYTNEICSNISSTIDADKYSIASTLSIDYNKDTRNIFVQIKDKFGNLRVSELSFDKVTSSQIVDRVEILTPPTPGIDVPTIRIWWMPKPAEGETQKSTDIPVADLAQVYKSGDGISITDNLSICVDDTVARITYVNGISSHVIKLSTETIPEIETNVSDIQTFVDELSSKDAFKPGILLQLSNAITSDVANISELSGSVKKISTDIAYDINELSNDIKIIKNFDDMLCVVVDDTPVGVIPKLSNDIKLLGTEIRTATNYGGIITLCKYHPDWITSGYGNELSSIFKWANLAIDDKLKNGNLYQIEFTPDTYEYSDTTFAADQSYTTDDGYVLHHKDWLYVATGDSTTYVPLTALTNANVHHIQSVQFDEYHQLSNVVRANYPWLAGNNTLTAKYEISVETNGRVPVIISAEGHAFGPNNDFEGNNRFYGTNYIENLSAGTISADWKEVKHPTGYSLFDLSTDLSNKIWIKDIGADSSSKFFKGTTSDLSIIKIAKDEYDKHVALGDEPLCNNVLYIVSADYMDAYGQVLSNLEMTGFEGHESEATNKWYVDTLSANLSSEIQKLSTALSNNIDTLSANLSNEIEKLSTDLSNNIDTLSANLSNEIEKLSTDLSNAHNFLSDALSSNIDTLSANLSTEISAVRFVFSTLYKKISSIDQNSLLSDVISSVVAIKDAIKDLTAY